MDTTGLERFDPKRHTDDDFVLVEMYADSGELFRAADPVAVIRPHAEEWVRRLTDAGASPASAQWAINARSGTPPEDGTEGAADHSDKRVRPWPFEPAPATDDTPEG